MRAAYHVLAFSDGFLVQMFDREVFALLLRENPISQALVVKIAGWHHSGFSAYSKLRAKTRKKVERIGKYMIRPLLSL